MVSKNYYDILGVSKDASQADIKRAYKKASIKWHPDKHINDSDEDKKKAEEKFKEINEAYETLGDESKRAEYDNPNTGFSDFFKHFSSGFGGFNPFETTGRQIRSGEPAFVTLNISIKDLYSTSPIDVTYNKNVRCDKCHGSGGKTKTCDVCHGTGTIVERRQVGGMVMMETHMCSACHGTGNTIIEPCSKCHGSGFTEVIAHYSILPRYIDITKGESYKTVLSRVDGNESLDIEGPNGPLIGLINIDFGDYIIDNFNNVFERVEVPYYDMVLGGNIDIKLPNDTIITLPIKPNSKPNDMIKSTNDGIRGGDYYASLIPSFIDVSNKERELLKEIKNLHK